MFRGAIHYNKIHPTGAVSEKDFNNQTTPILNAIGGNSSTVNNIIGAKGKIKLYADPKTNDDPYQSKMAFKYIKDGTNTVKNLTWQDYLKSKNNSNLPSAEQQLNIIKNSNAEVQHYFENAVEQQYGDLGFDRIPIDQQKAYVEKIYTKFLNENLNKTIYFNNKVQALNFLR